MNFHQTQNFLKLVLNPFESSSLISDDGKLLASCDEKVLQSTTSRLVVCQIIKKYLNPQIGDLFILNDPDNGGLNYQNIFFTTRLTEKLYLVFVQELGAIEFKIPPTPLFEKGSKNKTIWPFLVEQNPQAQLLAEFFEKQWHQVCQLKKLNPFLQDISLLKNQQSYFKVVQQIFDRQFSNKALGQSESIYKMTPTDFIKLKLAIDEKQNQRTIYADFSQSSPASKISAASHIIESCLVKALADQYGMMDLLSQPLLDRIRLTLPPQSIVSKSHPQGIHNLLLQKIVSEQVAFLLTTLMGSTKNKSNIFKLIPEFRMNLKIANRSYSLMADNKKFIFSELDYLIQTHQVIPLVAQNSENKIMLKLQIKTKDSVVLVPQLILNEYPSSDFLSISGQAISLNNETILKYDDIFELTWKLN